MITDALHTQTQANTHTHTSHTPRSALMFSSISLAFSPASPFAIAASLSCLLCFLLLLLPPAPAARFLVSLHSFGWKRKRNLVVERWSWLSSFSHTRTFVFDLAHAGLDHGKPAAGTAQVRGRFALQVRTRCNVDVNVKVNVRAAHANHRPAKVLQLRGARVQVRDRQIQTGVHVDKLSAA